jgi:hypothetical protein
MYNEQRVVRKNMKALRNGEAVVEPPIISCECRYEKLLDDCY